VTFWGGLPPPLSIQRFVAADVERGRTMRRCCAPRYGGLNQPRQLVAGLYRRLFELDNAAIAVSPPN
jgi:hypothetical protein